MGSRPTSFASDHADRSSRRKRPGDVAARSAVRQRAAGRPLHEVAARLSAKLLDLPAANVAEGIDLALRQLAESLPADRLTLFLRTTDASSFAEVARYSMVAGEGVRASDPDSLADLEHIEGFDLGDYPYLAAQLGKAEAVVWRTLEDVPDEARFERSFFRDPKVASLLFVPMVSRGSLTGLLQVEALAASRQWSPDVPSLASVVVTALAGVIDRKGSEAKLAKMEERLQTTERLEIVGRLTSGVAHDFNNYLTAILGNTYLLTSELEDDSVLNEEVDEIQHAAENASRLVEQVLGIARGKSHERKVLDLNSVLAESSKTIERVAGDGVEVAYQFGRDLMEARVDPGKVEQLVLNIVTNARDAMMPEGGLLTVATNAVAVAGTSDVLLDVGQRGGPVSVKPPRGLAPGKYVVMSLLDTGCGMSEDTRAHLFEPFYTTKPEGSGTGIGLSSVAAIVREAEGEIAVTSKPGAGSSFHIFLPMVIEKPFAVHTLAERVRTALDEH